MGGTRELNGIQIESGIQPQGRRRRRWLAVLVKMQVGDSFEVGSRLDLNRILSSAKSTRDNERKTIQVPRIYVRYEEQESGRFRVWRTK
jgi:hypothetical protein